MTQAFSNKALVQASFDRWRNGAGSPFDLLADDATWTIEGTSPLSKTYWRNILLDQVMAPFNARLATPVVPKLRGLHADGDTVIALFDGAATATDGQPYRNSYAWFMRMNAGKIVEVTAFLDTRALDEFWARVSPGAS